MTNAHVSTKLLFRNWLGYTVGSLTDFYLFFGGQMWGLLLLSTRFLLSHIQKWYYVNTLGCYKGIIKEWYKTTLNANQNAKAEKNDFHTGFKDGLRMLEGPYETSFSLRPLI